MPTAYAKMESGAGSVTPLNSATGFSVSFSRDNMESQFSITLAMAQKWNRRFLGQESDPEAQISLFYGDRGYNEGALVPLFFGTVKSVRESYAFGSECTLSISGSNAVHKMKSIDGTYSSSTYTGYSKDLLIYWCEQVGVDYSFTYTDNLYIDGVTINYSNILQGFNSVKQALGPGVECYVDAAGKLIMRDVSVSTPEFYYDESNILSIKPAENYGNVYSKAEVVGDPSTITYTAEKDAAYIAKFGTRTYSVSSGLISSQSYAQTLAETYLEDLTNQLNEVSMSIRLNPYLTIGSVLAVKDSSLSTITNTLFRVTSLKHAYRFGQDNTSNLTGYFI